MLIPRPIPTRADRTSPRGPGPADPWDVLSSLSDWLTFRRITVSPVKVESIDDASDSASDWSISDLPRAELLLTSDRFCGRRADKGRPRIHNNAQTL